MLSTLRAVKVIAESGVIRPYRPSRLLRLSHTVLSWGTGTAGGAITLANRFPDEVGIIDDLGSLTFEETHRRSNALARGLAGLGVAEGDVVAVMCRNSRYFIEATNAVAKLGADVLYLNTSFAGPQLVEVVERERPVAVICDEEFGTLLGEVEQSLVRVVAWTESHTADNPAVMTASAADHAPANAAEGASQTRESLIASNDDFDLPATDRRSRCVILTSGTTGTPKGASRAGGGLGAAVSLLSLLPLRTRWTTHIAAPLFHTWGWAHFQLGMLLGSTIVLTRRFDPANCLQLVEQHECDSLVVIAVMLQRILDAVGPTGDEPATYDLSALKVVAASGSALPGDLAIEWMDAYGDNLYNVYGSTEVAWATIATPADLRAAPGTAGRPPLGTEVRLYDEDDRLVAPDGPGRIFVRNSALFEGYTGGGTKDVIDEMMATGDVGRFDDEGRLFVEGRDDDMIVSGGENVFPQEVEDLLARHDAVAEVAVVGVDDEKFGQRLRAFVVLRSESNVSADDLRGHIKAHLARYKVPRDIVFVDELPRTSTGKVLKRELADYDPGST